MVKLGESEAQAYERTQNKPKGTYKLQLVHISDALPQKAEYDNGVPRHEFTFTVLDFEPKSWPQPDDYTDDMSYEIAWDKTERLVDKMRGSEVKWTWNVSLGKQGYFRPVYEALVGREITDKNEEVETDLIIRKRIIAKVGDQYAPGSKDPKPGIVDCEPLRDPSSSRPRRTSSSTNGGAAPDDREPVAVGVNPNEIDSVDDVPF